MMTEKERQLMELNGLTEADMVKQNSNDASEIAELREALMAYVRGDLE